MAVKVKILDATKQDDGSTEIEVRICGKTADVIVRGGDIIDIAANFALSDLSDEAQAALDQAALKLAAKYL